MNSFSLFLSGKFGWPIIKKKLNLSNFQTKGEKWTHICSKSGYIVWERILKVTIMSDSEITLERSYSGSLQLGRPGSRISLRRASAPQPGTPGAP